MPDLHALLKQHFGYDTFRPQQEDIIRTIIGGSDAIVLMPTGGGKSLCYQIPALDMEGTAIVVSPLISLMKDQVDALRANGIAAAALNSAANNEENRKTLADAVAGKLDLLYMSPERLVAGQQWLAQNVKVSFVAIDEAHCVSQWGHDFRPEYTQLGGLHEVFHNVPVVALTATADKTTRSDIAEQLRLREPKTFIASFDRPNLSLAVKAGYDAKERLTILLELIARHKGESGIVYCLSRANAEKIANSLAINGVSADVYHAKLSAEQRTKVQDDFANDRTAVVCATVAFGMGIDKSNVRFVVHYNLPKSIECYYQEIGRAGRDGLPAETLLFYNIGDLSTLRRFADESGQREINNEKLDRMQEYAEARICRRRILLNYFAEQTTHDCGNCDVCNAPQNTFDGTQIVQKALSAIKRTGEQVGITLLIDVLRGSRNQLVIASGFDKIKTYGAGRDIPPADWRKYLQQMLQLGYIEIDYRNAAHLRTTPAGDEVLFGRQTATLTVPVYEDYRVKGNKLQRTGAPVIDFSTLDVNLQRHLKDLRKRIAAEKGVPAFVVFSDKTINDIVEKCPTTIEDFGKCYGVGEYKLRTLGPRFIEAIKEYNSKQP